METTDAQKKATAKWQKKNVTQRIVKFYPKDAELLKWLDTQPNKNAYILGLIRADMRK